MSRQAVWVALMMGSVLGAAQAAPPRVGVLGIVNHHSCPEMARLHDALAYNLEAALSQTGRFTVIGGPAFQRLLGERQSFGSALREDPERALEAQPLEVLDYLVTGTLQGDSASTATTIEFIHARGPHAGQVAVACRAVGVTVPYVGYLASDLAQAAREAFPLHGRIVSVSPVGVVVNLGHQDGLVAGEELLVEELGPEQRDPATGQVVYQERIALGRLKVRTVQVAGALAEVLNQTRVAVGLAVTTVQPAEQPVEDWRKRLVVAETAAASPLPVATAQWAGSLLASELAQRQKAMQAQVLEREHLAQVFAEIGLQETGLFDRTKAVRAGKLLAADTLIVSTLGKSGDDYVLAVRIVTAGSGDAQVAVTRRGAFLEKVVADVASGIADLLRPTEPHALAETNIDGAVTFGYDVVPVGQYGCLTAVGPPLVEFSLRNRGETPVRVRLVTDLGDFSVKSVNELALAPGERRQFAQTPPLQRAVGALEAATAAQVNCRVETAPSGTPLLEDSHSITLLPSSSWLARLPTRRMALPLSIEQTIVEWVRDSARLQELRAEGARRCRLERLYGYQPAFLNGEGWPTATPDQRRAAVRAQIAGLYEALQAQDLAYVEQAQMSLLADAGQSVLLPDDALRQRRANCLDSTVLFAALLCPSFDPLLVIGDGHAFVGWRTWDDEVAGWDVLETTLLTTSGATFEQALARGQEEAARLGVWDRLQGQGATQDFDDAGLLTPPVPGAVVIGVRAAQRHLERCRWRS